MKLALALFLVSVLGTGTAFGQAGAIGIFSDPSGTNPYVLDQPPAGLKMYYVVHVNTLGATASQYRAKLPLCMTQTGAMWLSDANIWPVCVGNSQVGFAIAYGSCRVGSIHTQTINVFAMGTTPACCRWVVDADPNVPSGRIEGSDCNFQLIYPAGGQGIVNADWSCHWSPVEETTWGHVKALFEE